MLSVKQAKWLLHFLLPLFIAVFSICVCSKKFPETQFYTESIESLEESQETVTKLTAGTLGLSLIINFLPDDYGSSLADSLTELNKYFVLLLVAIFLEKLIAVEGSTIAFTYLIPAACALYLFSYFFKQEAFLRLVKKIAILALALILVIPCGTHFANTVAGDYLDYVDTTIEETQDNTSKLSDTLTQSDDSQTLIEKFSTVISSAISSIKDIAGNIKNIISKFMISIAILIIINCIVPALMFIFFLWILQQITSIDFSKVSRLQLSKEDKENLQELVDQLHKGGKDERHS